MPPAVVLLSGGLDSYTTAAVARRDGFELYALSFRYGQRHALELEAASRIARVLGVTRHLVLDKRVALKVLAMPESLPAGEKIERASRLLEEARLLSRLRHPNVVAAVDSGLLPPDETAEAETATVQPYLVLEWCDGPTLKAFASLEDGAREALERDLVALAGRHDRLGTDAIAIPATYLEAVAIRR